MFQSENILMTKVNLFLCFFLGCGMLSVLGVCLPFVCLFLRCFTCGMTEYGTVFKINYLVEKRLVFVKNIVINKRLYDSAPLA